MKAKIKSIIEWKSLKTNEVRYYTTYESGRKDVGTGLSKPAEKFINGKKPIYEYETKDNWTYKEYR